MRRATCADEPVVNFCVCLRKSGTDQLFQIATSSLRIRAIYPIAADWGIEAHPFSLGKRPKSA